MKTAVITGGNKGLGLFQTRRFLAAGYAVHVVARSKGELEDPGDDIRFLEHDLADWSDTSWLDAIHERSGGIDVLVNNAGVHLKKPAWELDAPGFDAVLDINVKAMMMACGRFVALRRELGAASGAIVNISSMGGLMALPNSAAYVTAKTAVIGLTRSVAVDAAPFGIRCNAVCPGFIDTDMTRAILEKRPRAARPHRAAHPVRPLRAPGGRRRRGPLPRRRRGGLCQRRRSARRRRLRDRLLRSLTCLM